MFQYSLSGADIKKEKIDGTSARKCGLKSTPHKSVSRSRRKYKKFLGKSSRRRDIYG
jgi:hypothetical protein